MALGKSRGLCLIHGSILQLRKSPGASEDVECDSRVSRQRGDTLALTGSLGRLCKNWLRTSFKFHVGVKNDRRRDGADSRVGDFTILWPHVSENVTLNEIICNTGANGHEADVKTLLDHRLR